jgi:hypothetical protein
VYVGVVCRLVWRDLISIRLTTAEQDMFEAAELSVSAFVFVSNIEGGVVWMQE